MTTDSKVSGDVFLRNWSKTYVQDAILTMPTRYAMARHGAPNHNKPYQTRPYQTRPDQTTPNNTTLYLSAIFSG